MCGIVGAMALRADRAGEVLRSEVEAMSSCLRHRGPDDDGVWVEPSAGLAFGHRRLAVVDLSPAGAQPMLSADGRLVLSFNGEIYNHHELRRRLAALGHVFRGGSDTEVLLAAVAQWGVDEALRQSEGMFAFALWDRRSLTLTLARDRMGEKPLYVGWAGDTLLFASELSALRAHPSFEPEIDTDAVADLLRRSCVPAPRSIYRHVQKVRPGHVVEVVRGAAAGALPTRAYWDLATVAEQSLATPVVDAVEALDELERLLALSVERQMLADVPVGCFLSGGVDSSLVTAIAQEQASSPVRTFTIGFDEPAWDEAPHARAVAGRLGTDHTELYVSGQEALGVVPRLARIYDEPFADSSQIPTFLVSQLARRHVTVALSGDGGDELFAGYDRYRAHQRLATLVREVPAGVRTRLARAALALPAARWDALVGQASRVAPAARVARPGEKIHKAARLLGTRSPASLYDDLMAAWPDPSSVLHGEVTAPAGRSLPSGVAADPVRSLQLLDQLDYLPDDLLAKVDRAAMAVSLETRVPLLSSELVRHSWRMPTRDLIVGGRGKQPLRELLKRRLPDDLVDRPKQGFAIPLGPWLRGPLREWAHDLLSPDALRQDGLLRVERLQQLLAEHDEGRVDRSAQLWPVLMLRAWQAEQRGKRPAATPCSAPDN